jgi:tetratricopeptide (TPR) repeat protein
LAEDLLNEQYDFGRKTGNLSFCARSLALFAAEIRDWDIGAARKWAKELVEVEPYDPRPWNLLVNVLDPHRAWRSAWAVVDRFPLDGYVRSGLAEVLKKQARFAEAEEVYRQAVEDFPRNVVMRGGLADVLKRQDRLGEAEEVYRQTVKGFPRNPFVRNGLADVLKRQDRLGEAEEVYERAVGDFPDNPVCRNGLARVLALQAIATESVDSARLARARELYLAVANDPAFDRHNRCVALNGWAWVCERIGNLDEAEKFYRDVLRVDHHDSYAAHGLQRIARRRAGTSETDHFEAPSPVEEEMEESLPPRAWDETLPEDDARTADDTFAAGTAAVRAFQWHPTGYHLRLARAAFFRRAADRQENLPPRPGRFSPNTLRDAARKMLTEVLALRATDPRALAALASLDFQEGRKTGVFGQVLAQGMAEVLAVAANVARREAKRDDAKLTDAKALQSVLDAASGLRSLGPAGRPLADIAEGLGYLALQDGTARLVGAADAFEHLHLWIRPRAIQAEALAALETRAPTAGSPLTRVLDWSGRVATHFLERAGVDLRADSPVSPDAADRIDRRSAELVPLLEQASLDYAKDLSPRIEELFEAAEEG